jgi:hypothetical protein
VKNLSHSASFESFDKDAPAKPGTKHLREGQDLASARRETQPLAKPQRRGALPRHTTRDARITEEFVRLSVQQLPFFIVYDRAFLDFSGAARANQRHQTGVLMIAAGSPLRIDPI